MSSSFVRGKNDKKPPETLLQILVEDHGCVSEAVYWKFRVFIVLA